MRVVIGIIVLGLVLPAFTVQAAKESTFDDCDDALTAAEPCARVTTPSPAAKKFYIHLGILKCEEMTNSNCRGAGSGANMAKAPLRQAGIIYEETNGYPGLQRTQSLIDTRLVVGDAVVLL